MRRELVAAVLLCAGAAAPARAGVLSEDPLEEKSTELGVVLRAFSFVLTSDVLEPPFNLEDANPAATGLFDLRFYFARKSPSLTLVAHSSLASTVRSSATLGVLGLGRGVPPPRLLPLTFEAADEPTVALVNATDWLYAAYTHGSLTVTIGRQPISFGQAKIFRPTDLVSTFALTEVSADYKPGADAVRVDYSHGDNLTLTAIASTGELETDHDLEASLQGTTAMFEIKRDWSMTQVGVIGGMFRGDAVAGITAVRDIGPVNAYTEATATLVTSDSLPSPVVGDGDVVPRAVVGATMRTGKLTVSPELLWNGFGSFDRADYLALATSTRVAIGEQTTLGRAYAGTTLEWEAHPLVRVGGVALVNLADPSALFSAAVSYSISDNTLAVIGAYVPAGKQPRAAGLEVRSEYGLFPVFAFFHLKAVI